MVDEADRGESARTLLILLAGIVLGVSTVVGIVLTLALLGYYLV